MVGCAFLWPLDVHSAFIVVAFMSAVFFFFFSLAFFGGEQYVQKILDGFLGEILVSTIARTPIVLSFLELNSIHRAVSQVWGAYF